MPLDSLLIHSLVSELSETLEGARVDKVFMPSANEVILALRGQGGSMRLMISRGGANPGVYITSLRPENPASPPMFCMLLRKHLQGGRILSVDQPGGERIIRLRFSSTGELGDSGEKILLCELMGRQTNIILLDENGVILGCIRKSDYESSERAVLPGLMYRPPRRSGAPSLFEITEADLAGIIRSAGGVDLPRLIEGVSPFLAREIEARGGGPEESAYFITSLRDDGGTPNMFTRRGKSEGEALCYISRQEGENSPKGSYSQLLDDLYAERRQADTMRNISSSLRRGLDQALERVRRRLGKQCQELLSAQGREELKRQADLITANIYAIKSGDTHAVVTDFFSPDMPQVTIPLDPDLSPQANAQMLYKRYSRMKNAEEALSAAVARGEEEERYIESLIYSLSQATGEREIEELTREAASAGYIQQRKTQEKKKQHSSPFAPRRYRTAGGFTLLRGRNNRENDYLTTRQAKGGDIWFHARNVPGSHVVLLTDGRRPSEKDILQAAALAAFYSSAGTSTRVSVDYTPVRNVKKPQGARPGMVNYFSFRTLIVPPEDMEEDKQGLAEVTK